MLFLWPARRGGGVLPIFGIRGCADYMGGFFLEKKYEDTPFFYKNTFYKNNQVENRQIFKKVLRIIVRLILYFPSETFILGGFHGKITLLAVN